MIVYDAHEEQQTVLAEEAERGLWRRLDDVASRAQDIGGVMAGWSTLLALAQQIPPSQMAALVETMRRHPVAQIAWQDPFTSWSYRKPRGYSGDARLIDFIYGHPSTTPDITAASPTGRAVHAYTFGSESPVAVRERRRFLAHLLDDAVERVGAPDVLAVACGHLREVELARHARQIRRFIALDQDGDSLSEISRCYPDLTQLDLVKAQIGRLIIRPTMHGRFDLVYAAGIYDYLQDRTATRLTAGLFAALKPGGTLFFANFADGIADRGYMDAFMDWRLILREEADLQRMVDGLPAQEIAQTRLFRGNNRAVIYASVTRKG